MTALLALLAATLSVSLLLWLRVRELQSRAASHQADLVRLGESRAALEQELRGARDQHQTMQQTFAALSREALEANSGHLVRLAEQVLQRAQASSQAELDKRAHAVAEMVKPVHDQLKTVDEKIVKLEKAGEVSATQLKERLQALVNSEEKLRGETARLVTALRSPAQRGRWGETQLRRTLELAGLRAHVDFQEQPVAQLLDGVLRPDAAVRLPGGKTVLIDAKVPLEAYLRAIEAPEGEKEPHLRAHAQQLRSHIDSLSKKQYWEAFDGSPEMAVLFLPSDGLLAAALDADPQLHQDAFARRIVLATPCTLLSLLLTIAHVWKQESIALNAREIANEGRELHKRIADLSRHLAKLGRALEGALKTYNGAVGSFDTRVVPAARRFEHLKAAAADVQLEALTELEVLPRLPRPSVDDGETADPEEAN